ncbi:aspartate/glutamate racemase family protein [Tersicoccus sp. Bi-70]|uniref:aspartate/glutamate racemase family protein n=1 Tax=Tersicoccus sp. Bi-70 TaxID=1897634 RepID=UPI0009761F9E|nr:aspartate/glutamate racemase family protein [Tersicoccus sp. Bi-70]OMH32994.1 hydantoin racemase [Tersicoccus sp. Bi-70]
MKVGLIRAVTATDPRLLDSHGAALENTFGFEVVTRAIEDQPDGVFDDASLAAAIPKVVRLAVELAPDVDAIVISCAADPGLEIARSLVDIPVVGAGSAAAAAAAAFGGTVGVLGLSRNAPTVIADAIGDRMLVIDGAGASHRPADYLTPTGVIDAITDAHLLADAGADVIVLGTTGLSSIGMAAELRRRLELPVIDAVIAAGSMLASGVAARQNHAHLV